MIHIVLWHCCPGDKKGIQPQQPSNKYPPKLLFQKTANNTKSSAIAGGPRDASCQLKSCQLPRNSAETTCTTSPEQIEVMKLEGYSGPMCNKHVHSIMTLSSRFYGCQQQTDYGLSCGYHLYTDDLLWRNFLSPQCRNCSRAPDHAHLGNTHSSQD